MNVNCRVDDWGFSKLHEIKWEIVNEVSKLGSLGMNHEPKHVSMAY